MVKHLCPLTPAPFCPGYLGVSNPPRVILWQGGVRAWLKWCLLETVTGKLWITLDLSVVSSCWTFKCKQKHWTLNLYFEFMWKQIWLRYDKQTYCAKLVSLVTSWMFPAYFNVTLEELKHLILNIAAEFFFNFPFFKEDEKWGNCVCRPKNKAKEKNPTLAGKLSAG